MNNRTILNEKLDNFKKYLVSEEKSMATMEKYLRDARAFLLFVGENEITKELTIAYKNELKKKGYAVRSINSMLSSVNTFLKYIKKSDCTVKIIRVQREMYCSKERELTKTEYLRLLEAAKEQQIKMIMQTICGTGIRVSELRFFTVEAVKSGKINVNCKGKIRTIFIPSKLKKRLLDYAKKRKINSGYIFVTKEGKIMDRSVIWAKMKKLCEIAKVAKSKVFPHNLRKLFAKTFYKSEKDIAKLADILGHGSIETTRIYIMTTGEEHCRKIEQLGLVI